MPTGPALWSSCVWLPFSLLLVSRVNQHTEGRHDRNPTRTRGCLVHSEKPTSLPPPPHRRLRGMREGKATSRHLSTVRAPRTLASVRSRSAAMTLLSVMAFLGRYKDIARMQLMTPMPVTSEGRCIDGHLTCGQGTPPTLCRRRSVTSRTAFQNVADRAGWSSAATLA